MGVLALFSQSVTIFVLFAWVFREPLLVFQQGVAVQACPVLLTLRRFGVGGVGGPCLAVEGR